MGVSYRLRGRPATASLFARVNCAFPKPRENVGFSRFGNVPPPKISIFKPIFPRPQPFFCEFYPRSAVMRALLARLLGAPFFPWRSAMIIHAAKPLFAWDELEDSPSLQS